MDAEKLAMQRRIDTLDQYATRLHAALTEYERENARLKAELETVKRERDAAVRDIWLGCDTCKHKGACLSDDFCEDCEHAESDNTPCCSCHNLCEWEWRGLCKENGGIET